MGDQLRKQNKELQKLYDTTNKIYSVIGRDLKTPLSSILGISDLTISEIEENRDLEENYEIICQSSLKISGLLEDLL